MDQISLKHAISCSFAGIVDMEEMKGHVVYFLTPIGLVSGKPLSLAEIGEVNESNVSEFILSSVLKGAWKYVDDKMEKNQDLTRSPEDGFIILKDVCIRPMDLSSTSSTPVLVLFIDQIIGAFVGSASYQTSPAQG